ncbi:baseplate J/gp47 family protein [Streptomyces wuyuanensis]|uniref:baseplate J/gp47 family protein n=1 Tax=Streptomyces wuyuanensis TaxID=1196353 RepID=UPI00343DD04A
MDNAKRLIPHLYPEWTDHNVSDPGITLVEACAARIDELSYRLGRVPGPVREAFLRLLAPPRRSAVPARALLTFTREPGPAAPVPLVVPAGTQVATGSTSGEKIVFTLQEEVCLPPSHAFVYGKAVAETDMPPAGEAANVIAYSGTLTPEGTYDAGEPGPTTSAIILVADPGPDKLLTLHLSLQAERGRPGPIQWQISAEGGWAELESLGASSPQPFAGPFQETLKVPGGRLRYHPTVKLGSGETDPLFTPADEYLALRLTAAAASAGTATWSITGLHPAEAVSAPAPALQIVPFSQQQSTSARSTGSPSQRVRLAAFPVADRGISVTVQPTTGMVQTWTRTTSFATSGPDDPHYVLDAPASEIVFGPTISTPDGQRLCGRIPADGAVISARADTTRGAQGNVPSHSLTHFAGVRHRPQPVPDAVVTTEPADYVFVGPLVASRPHTDSPPEVKRYTDLWPALTQFPRIDAAVDLSEESFVFFCGSSYLVLPSPFSKRHPPFDQTPLPISSLLGSPVSLALQPFAHGIDAAVRIDATKVFLFKGPLVLAMSVQDDKLSTPGTPEPITTALRFLPPSFSRDLSAATAVHGSDGMYHLFRGADYVEVRKTPEGVLTCTFDSPKPSADLWPGIERIMPRITVTNPAPAAGGSDPETFTDLLRNAPAGLTHPQRAVTVEGYEHALRDAVPGLARVICLTPTESHGDLSLLLVPELPAGTPPTAHSLTPSPGMVTAACERLEGLRLLGTRVLVTYPSYHRVRITATITTDTPPPHTLLREQVRAALVSALHPLTGGRAQSGWPLDRLPTAGDVITAMAGFPGTQVTGDPLVEDLDTNVQGSAFLPVLDLLDLAINGVAHRDSDVLTPPGSQAPATADRSVSLALSTTAGRIWHLTDHTVENGHWVTQPPADLTHDSAVPTVVCAATDRNLPLSAQITYQLAGTDESTTLSWTNPPAGINTYSINTTQHASLALSSANQPGPDAVTGFRALSGGALPPSGNNAHAQLAAALDSTLKRSLTITLHDVSHDAWKFSISGLTDGTVLTPSTIPDVPGGGEVTFTLTNPATTGDLVGSLTCTPAGGTALILGLKATDKGEVIYTVDHDAPVTASIGSDKITTSGLHRSTSQDGGGLHASVHISLKNTAHRSATLALRNTLLATLQRANSPGPKLEKGSWIVAPPEYISKGDTGRLSCTVDDPKDTMTGNVTYTYQMVQSKESSVTVGWESASDDTTTFTVTCPKDSEVKTDGTPWTAEAPETQGEFQKWTLTKRTT